MSPDSVESRLGRLEQNMAATRQQVNDVVEDVRVFAPLVASQAEMRATLTHIVARMEAQGHDLADLKREFELDKKDREKGQAERARGDRSNRTLLWVAAIGLLGTFILAAAAVVAAVVQ